MEFSIFPFDQKVIRQNMKSKFKKKIAAGIVSKFLVKPFILRAILTCEVYKYFLINSQFDLLELNIQNGMSYMHDGTPVHAYHQVVNKTFRNHWIGRNVPVNWAEKILDLNPLDFYSWITCNTLFTGLPYKMKTIFIKKFSQYLLKYMNAYKPFEKCKIVGYADAVL